MTDPSNSTPATTVYLDEAGYTGPDLANREQLVYVLASTSLSEDHARALLDACFRRNHQGRELKHSRLSRTKIWRTEVIEFVRQLPKDAIAYFAVHKEFALLAFFIDFWFEPLAYQDGVNLYDQGANIALSNVSYITLQTTLGREGCGELLRRFQVMTRDRTSFAYDSFWQSFYDAVNKHDSIEKALGALIAAEQRLGPAHLQRLPADLLDLGDYGLLDTVVYWRKKSPGVQFDLVHDRSKMIERHRERWVKILKPDNPKAVVGSDRRTIEFPLPVRTLRLAESHTLAGLQVADLVAGTAYAVWNAKARNQQSEYTRALMEAGIAEGTAGGIWPTKMISPEELETGGPFHADAATFIAELIGHEGSESS